MESLDDLRRSRALLTIEEFAAKTGYSRRTTERLIASGVLRSTKVGRLRRIVPADLVALIEAGMDPRHLAR